MKKNGKVHEKQIFNVVGRGHKKPPEKKILWRLMMAIKILLFLVSLGRG